MSAKLIPVSEIFLAVQGEGLQIGVPTVFIRTGGCDFRCSWCDSMYAVDPKHRNTWRMMDPAAIMAEVTRVAGRPLLVTLSGGNPAIHDQLEEVVRIGHGKGFTFTMETQGSHYRPWMNALDFICVSPKPPSSGMASKFDRDTFTRFVEGFGPTVSVKIVVFNPEDFEWALGVRKLCNPSRVRFYLQVGNTDVAADAPHETLVMRSLHHLQTLQNIVLDRKLYDITVLPQLHALIHGNQRGV